MIEESEKRGTAGIKSHAALLKSKILNIKVSSTIPNTDDFAIRVYGNITIWELKEMISNRLKYCIDFIKFTIDKSTDLKNSENGKTVLELNFEDGFEIKVSPNGIDKLIPQADLHFNGQPNPEIVKVFNEWFDKYSNEDSKMTKELCAKFVSLVTNTREEIKEDDYRINSLFMMHDKNKDDMLERDEFIGFYVDCATTPAKKKVTWENLRNMGVRNDLKRMDEPYQSYNDDKTILPRYQLSYNEELFNTIFYLQDLNEDIAQEAFGFLSTITTNPNIYKQLLEGSDWKILFDSNIYKLIYSLQIIESFIEDAEIVQLDGFKTSEEMQNWMKNFVEKGGYEHLVNILVEKLSSFVDILNQGQNHSSMSNICVKFLLRIVKIFYISSLNKQEKYLNVNNTIARTSSVEVFTDDISSKIFKSLNYNTLLTQLLSLIDNLVNKKQKSVEENDIILTSYELTTTLIPYSEEFEKIEKQIVENKNLIDITFFGILNQSEEFRIIFSLSTIKLCKLLEYRERYNLIAYFFNNVYEEIKKLKFSSNEFFEFFSYLLEIYLSHTQKLNNIEFDYKQFAEIILKNILNDIQDNTVCLSNEVFIGYLKILTKIVENDETMKTEISEKYNLIQILLTKVLFKQNSEELTDKLNRIEFVNPDSFDDNKSNRNSNQTVRTTCYNFLLCMLRNSINNFEKFFSANVLDEQKEDKQSNTIATSRYKMSYYNDLKKSEGHVGLRNLGCICYMNSTLQQFFMVPSLRYNILNVDDNVEPDTSNGYNIDDNTFHQVQRMFSYLDMSERMDYNPLGFCYSFKDWDGNPTNTSIQQDTQEFLNMFFDKMENGLRPTNNKYLFQSVFGGKTCSQLICEGGCGLVKNRFEDFYTLSLEVTNAKTLYDSLNNYIQPERIDDYNCDQCKKKVSLTKKNSLSDLPNVLFVHLKRLFFNYETERNEKINSRLEFPRILNLKDYCIEEITRKSAAKDCEDNSEIETDEIYFKDKDYYEYHLTGVVCHWGSADSGHYYSFINTARGGNEHEAAYDYNNESHNTSWLEFNDSNISKFNINKLEDECFGGNYDTDKERKEMTWGNFKSNNEKIRSAYMLIYERRIKSPIKTIVNTLGENLVSFKVDEWQRIKKEYDICRYYGKEGFLEFKEKLVQTTFYDAAKDEYFKFSPFYSAPRVIPKKYYLEINDDNAVFQKQQNTSDEQFIKFFDSVIYTLDETFSNLNDIKLETSVKISKTFMYFIFNILSQKDKSQLLTTAKDKFINLIQKQPVCLVPVWEFISEHLKQLSDLLLNNNEVVVEAISEMVYDLIYLVHNESPEKFLEALNNNSSDSDVFSNAANTLNYIYSMFPKIPNKFVSKISPIMKVNNMLILAIKKTLQIERNSSILCFEECYDDIYHFLNRKR